METYVFRTCVGDSVDRTMAFIRSTLGKYTDVTFQFREHKGHNDRVKPERLIPNVVVLHIDTKWNAICRSPVFHGHVGTLADDVEEASVTNESDA